MKKHIEEKENAGDMVPVDNVSDMLPAVAHTGTRGYEDAEHDDLVFPRAKLMQPLSPELREFKELRPGQVINSLTKEELSKVFVPVFYYKEFIRFNPRKKDDAGFMSEFEPGALIWRTRDANDPRVIEQCDFGPNGEIPVALTTLNFFCLPIPNTGMPYILSFAKTSYKAGRNLLSLAKLRGGDMFSRKYKLSVKEENNAKGNYFVMSVNPDGDCDSETYKEAERLFQQFNMAKKDLKTHIEDQEV